MAAGAIGAINIHKSHAGKTMADLGDIAGAGLKFISGFFDRQAQEKANDQNYFASLQQMAKQEEFAKSGIQWKVADAQAAGIHPLFALGANTPSYSPSSVNFAPASIGKGLSEMGQDVSRAINATRGPQAREDAYSSTVKALTLKRMGLENDLLASQIAKISQAGGNPPLPTPSDPPKTLGVDDPDKTKPVYFGRGPFVPSTSDSPANTVEDEYGEVAGDTWGIIRALKDNNRASNLGGGFGKHVEEALRTLATTVERMAHQRRYRNAVPERWRGQF